MLVINYIADFRTSTIHTFPRQQDVRQCLVKTRHRRHPSNLRQLLALVNIEIDSADWLREIKLSRFPLSVRADMHCRLRPLLRAPRTARFLLFDFGGGQHKHYIAVLAKR